ncbi:MAG: type I methionyl aminopeptidase [Acidobacteria bacterium]|nr:MAG: type I methionyl aminopeptidase [Acidobacteriota bacterium]MCE7959628.1 type I methionyl aminopeptidase [Acidobacteria bacterium ACB2]
MITCKSRPEILRMERATRVVQEALAECLAVVAPGVTTEDIDQVAAAAIRERGAKAAFPGYRGYPKTICVSVDDEVVHGIPSPKRKLRAGQVVSLDLGAVVEGYFGDAARTVAVGEVPERVRRLVENTHAALVAGVEAVRVGGRIGDVGAAVEAVAKRNGYGVVREFVGHGIGTALHEKPEVPNYGPAGRRDLIREGMTLAIEPMLNLGTREVRVASDGWTVRTLDGRPSAHFEHTVVATVDGPVVLGFGRYGEDRVVPGVPGYDEYPLAEASRKRASA